MTAPKEISSWLDIDGWWNGQDADVYGRMVGAAIARVPNSRLINFVEVGCWFGRSTACMAALIRDSGVPYRFRFAAVDHWLGSHGDSYHLAIVNAHNGNMYPAFKANIEACGLSQYVTAIQKPSVEAANLFHWVDFVYIDGNHEYESVRTDLSVWWPKVSQDGFLGGHDYDHIHPGVREAVNEFAWCHKLIIETSGCNYLIRKVA